MAARVLPPTDEPVRTHVRARGEWFGFQEFMIRERAAGPVEGVEVLGAGARDAGAGGARGDRLGRARS